MGANEGTARETITEQEESDGVVLRTMPDGLSFQAHVIGKQKQIQILVFANAEVGPEQQHLIQRGGRFKYVVQYRDTPSGRFRESYIRFVESAPTLDLGSGFEPGELLVKAYWALRPFAMLVTDRRPVENHEWKTAKDVWETLSEILNDPE